MYFEKYRLQLTWRRVILQKHFDQVAKLVFPRLITIRLIYIKFCARARHKICNYLKNVTILSSFFSQEAKGNAEDNKPSIVV